MWYQKIFKTAKKKSDVEKKQVKIVGNLMPVLSYALEVELSVYVHTVRMVIPRTVNIPEYYY